MERTRVHVRSARERGIDVAPGRASILPEKKEAAAHDGALRCLAGKRKAASPSVAAGAEGGSYGSLVEGGKKPCSARTGRDGLPQGRIVMLKTPPRGSEAAGIRSAWGTSRSAPIAAKREAAPPPSARNAKGSLHLPTKRGDPSPSSFRAALGAASPRKRPNAVLVGKRGGASRPPMPKSGAASGACTTMAPLQIIPKANTGFAAAGRPNKCFNALSPNKGQKRCSSHLFLEPRPLLQKKAKHDPADLRRVVLRRQLEPADLRPVVLRRQLEPADLRRVVLRRQLEPADLRRVVQKRLRRLRLLAVELQRQKERKPHLKAFKFLKEIGKTPSRKYIGEVPGVDVGDEFYYRAELMVAGLHASAIRGIDSTFYDGARVATCVVSQKFKGYVNLMKGSDVLVYSGEGGNPSFENTRKAPPGDQKLERGNKALKNSMDFRTPVRVVHGFSVPREDSNSLASSDKTAVKYVYDGLYMVEDFWWEIGRMGFRVLKFQMRRLPGQPKLELKQVLRAKVAAERVVALPSTTDGTAISDTQSSSYQA